MDDLISRQDAIAIATQEGAYGYISAQELAEMPSAQRKGRWIDYGYNSCTCVCSCCGIRQDIVAKFLFSYCPNCGARMRGEEQCQ